MRKHVKGFSLIEIMVVVVILGILSAIIVPKVMNRPDEARRVKAIADIQAIQSALDLYKLDNGQYPTTDQGLHALIEKPTQAPVPHHWHAYLRNLPMDPWDRPYLYLNPGEHSEIDIFTYGADGQPSGDGANSVIGNWQTNSSASSSPAQ